MERTEVKQAYLDQAVTFEISGAMEPLRVVEVPHFEPVEVLDFEPLAREIQFDGRTLVFTPDAVYVDGEKLPGQHWISPWGGYE